MKLLLFIFIVSILISVLKMALWLLMSLICYSTEGKFFGKFTHKTLNRDKRIIKVGKDWFVLEQQNKGGR